MTAVSPGGTGNGSAGSPSVRSYPCTFIIVVGECNLCIFLFGIKTTATIGIALDTDQTAEVGTRDDEEKVRRKRVSMR